MPVSKKPKNGTGSRLDVVTATVTVMAGGTATQNFDLTRNLPVGQFTVSADREWAAATVPEQKIQNVKKTVALDSFGGFLKNELIIRGQSYP